LPTKCNAAFRVLGARYFVVCSVNKVLAVGASTLMRK
jgi:hypothetical protein